jgi:hypothetical protein
MHLCNRRALFFPVRRSEHKKMISQGEKWGSRRRMNRVIDQKVELSFGVLHSQILKSNL